MRSVVFSSSLFLSLIESSSWVCTRKIITTYFCMMIRTRVCSLQTLLGPPLKNNQLIRALTIGFGCHCSLKKLKTYTVSLLPAEHLKPETVYSRVDLKPRQV